MDIHNSKRWLAFQNDRREPCQRRLKKGAWDIFIPLARQGFHGMFIEMKYGKNKLTPEQAEFGEFVSEQGYKTFVSYNWQDATTQ